MTPRKPMYVVPRRELATFLREPVRSPPILGGDLVTRSERLDPRDLPILGERHPLDILDWLGLATFAFMLGFVAGWFAAP